MLNQFLYELEVLTSNVHKLARFEVDLIENGHAAFESGHAAELKLVFLEVLDHAHDLGVK